MKHNKTRIVDGTDDNSLIMRVAMFWYGSSLAVTDWLYVLKIMWRARDLPA
jgi:hypothetical protein